MQFVDSCPLAEGFFTKASQQFSSLVRIAHVSPGHLVGHACPLPAAPRNLHGARIPVTGYQHAILGQRLSCGGQTRVYDTSGCRALRLL